MEEVIEEQLQRMVSVSDSYTVTMCTNGYLIDVSGKDTKGEWVSLKLLVQQLDCLSCICARLAEKPKD